MGMSEEVYERLTHLERTQDRHDERIKSMDETLREIRSDTRKIMRMIWQFGGSLAVLLWIANHFFNK
jgi:hypothetical protein